VRYVRRLERQQKTRDELLGAATRLFAARGFGGASVDEIAAAAGYTSGAIYANFAGKEDLFLSAFEEQIARHVREVTEAVSAAGRDEAARSAAGAQQWIDFLDRSPELFLLFVEYWAYAVRNPKRRQAFAERFAAFRETTARMLGRDAADPLAPAVNALVYGIAFQRLAEPHAVEDDVLRSSLEALFRGWPSP
jgi:AcrR family transcriptional regulator